MSRPRIGFSSCYFHADPLRPIFKGKTLLYLEESIAHWVQAEDVFAYMIPSIPIASKLRLKDIARDLDALVLQGGSDVSPESYGEKPLRPEWAGDIVRDRYEIELFHEFVAAGKPVLGICRGAQLINVALGGTLIQDIGTQIEKAGSHRNWDIYDQNFHNIHFESGSLLEKIYPGRKSAKINSVHHQSIRELGRGLHIEARSEGDSVIEAIATDEPDFVYAVQWHPEFHAPNDETLLDSTPLLRHFLSRLK